MSRLKFRYWHVKSNKYLSSDEMPLCHEDQECFEMNAWDNDVFEQWTGLTDKNGVEIFEGDIVNDGNFKYKVEWNINGCWHFKRVPNGEIYPQNYWELEVIGNIHENPELLEQS